MIAPMSQETSWQEAEKRAFEHLTMAAGSTKDRDAYLGSNPGVINAWHFESQEITREGESVLFARDQPSLAIPYAAVCVYTKRDRCQEWLMRIIGGLPIRNDETSNIALFRMASVGKIEPEWQEVANENKPVRVYTLEIGFDLVFDTGGKAARIGI